MWRVGPNDWRFVLYNPTDFTGSVYYRYCRNAACGTAVQATEKSQNYLHAPGPLSHQPRLA